MSTPWTKRGNDVQYHELNDPSPITDGLSYPQQSTKSPSQGDQDDVVQSRPISPTASPGHSPPVAPLGKPTIKKRLHMIQIFSTACSIICLALAVATVSNEHLSWRLGVKNYQLIVLGFLLGIMQLCLVSLAPTMFLQLEARFGPSTLQNYEGLLRNQVLSTGLSYVWRFILTVMVILPLGLSIAYKTFTGGESTMIQDATDYNPDGRVLYGMFVPPGLQLLGAETGISLFANATIPYIVASSSKDAPEPRFSLRDRVSGYNVLSLDDESTAMLDIPDPNFISIIQNILAGGESWNLTSPVFATVATFNQSIAEDLRTFNDSFQDVCEASQRNSSAYSHIYAGSGFAVDLINQPYPGDQSLQYVSLDPVAGIDNRSTCQNLSSYVQPHTITRKQCSGTWSITRGGIQLVDGACEDPILPPEKQKILVNNTQDLLLGVWYMPSLVEMLGPFATSRNTSEWKQSYLATSMAAMLWSRITAINGATSIAPDNTGFNALDRNYGDITYEDAGLIYVGNSTFTYIRPTLRKSPWLYVVLAIQPLLSVLILGLTLLLSSTPIDKGFGLISILSGIDRTSLESLTGATLSGRLRKCVKLVIQPRLEKGVARIEYHVAPSSAGRSMENGRLDRRLLYH